MYVKIPLYVVLWYCCFEAGLIDLCTLINGDRVCIGTLQVENKPETSQINSTNMCLR
jgi:hypothetical protein